uniref:PID domain-containing protein n=1 Tax=Timema poppense TaxID=170557 RepID=A0A7R9HB85_TIMPO|nr:unnamed protein product [Timema poppensis]
MATRLSCRVPNSVTVTSCRVPNSVTVPSCRVPNSVTVLSCRVPNSVTVLSCRVPNSVTVLSCRVPNSVTVPSCRVPNSVTVPSCRVPNSVTVPSCRVPNSVTVTSELCDEWVLDSGDSKDCDTELPPGGVTYLVKYLGSTLIETPSSEEATAEAIKTIITMAKASGKKLQRVALSVNQEGIRTVDIGTQDTHLEVSIYRYIATTKQTGSRTALRTLRTTTCLRSSRQTTHAVTLTVAQSFSTAYQLWQMSQEDSQLHHPYSQISTNMDTMTGIFYTSLLLRDTRKPFKTRSGETIARLRWSNNFRNKIKSCSVNEKTQENESRLLDNKNTNDSKTMLIDFSADIPAFAENGNSWVSFDDDRQENLNDSFTRLTSPQNLFPASSSKHHLHLFNNGGYTSNSCNWGETRSINLLCQ